LPSLKKKIKENCVCANTLKNIKFILMLGNKHTNGISWKSLDNPDYVKYKTLNIK